MTWLNLRAWKKAGIVYHMLTGLSASVAPLKAGNMGENEVPQDASSCPFNSGSQTHISPGWISQGLIFKPQGTNPQWQNSTRARNSKRKQVFRAASLAHKPFRNCVLVLYLLFRRAQSLFQQEAKRFQVTESLFHEAQDRELPVLLDNSLVPEIKAFSGSQRQQKLHISLISSKPRKCMNKLFRF